MKNTDANVMKTKISRNMKDNKNKKNTMMM